MTTVGYGDKAPQTFVGRAIALLWMFAGIVLISTFTAAVASALTAAELREGPRTPEDLPRFKVGAITGTASTDALRRRRVNPVLYANMGDLLAALERGAIDAAVHDRSLLVFAAGDAVRVLESQFDLQPYAMVLPEGSELREPVNRVMLERIRSRGWQDTVDAYLSGL